MDSVRKGPIDMGAAEQNSTLAAQTPTLAHASMWCCIIATPATGNKGLGTSNDSGLNRVPFKQIQITFFFFFTFNFNAFFRKTRTCFNREALLALYTIIDFILFYDIFQKLNTNMCVLSE